jgi:hypothetical protein
MVLPLAAVADAEAEVLVFVLEVDEVWVLVAELLVVDLTVPV